MLALSSLTRSHVETRQQIHFSFLTVSESPPKGRPIALHQLSTNDTSYIPCVEVSTKIQGPVAELAWSRREDLDPPSVYNRPLWILRLATFPRQLVQSDALKDPTCTSGSHLYSETLASCGGVAPLLLESTKIKNKGSLKPLRINQHL